MKIIIEDGFSKIQKTGIGQYTLMIENLLQKSGYDIVNIDKPFLSKVNNKILRRFLYNLWLNTIFLIKLLLIKDTVIVFCTNYALPIFKLSSIKFIPVIHDLCMFKFPELSSKLINRYEKSNVKNAIKKADKIITVSNTIKKEIIEEFDISGEKICVVWNSCSASLKEPEKISFEFLHNRYNIANKKYILSVATNNKRKNLSLLVNSFNKISEINDEIKLVLVGNNNNLYSNPNIIITGYINDSELECLYKHALIYVFPSLYEGFGIPMLDAQNFNIPVLCSNIPVFREVGGSSVEYFDLETANLYDKIINIINNENLIKQLVEKGQENLKRFSLTNINKQLNNVLNNIS